MPVYIWSVPFLIFTFSISELESVMGAQTVHHKLPLQWRLVLTLNQEWPTRLNAHSEELPYADVEVRKHHKRFVIEFCERSLLEIHSRSDALDKGRMAHTTLCWISWKSLEQSQFSRNSVNYGSWDLRYRFQELCL